jgi:homoserine O-succinyltransferase/O-acetyltransferase
MSASLNTKPSDTAQKQCDKGLCRKPSAQCLEKTSKSLNIGLINNMPDGALEATERQFLSLFNSASEGMSIRLSLYSLPDVPRNEFGARHVSQHYSSVDSMWDAQLDGLIVTGREPLTVNLEDEPYWESFTNVVDWARKNTYSSIWSCLAAHAATLYMDGICRIRNDNKHCGVFECERLSDHPLTKGTTSRFKLPHSRWNGLSVDELIRCGYRVLTQAPNAGADTFIKHCRSMFVFFQGHPEYESNTLLLEYRRDVARFLKGETNVYPLIPHEYFDDDTVTFLMNLQQEALSFPCGELLGKLSQKLELIHLESSWNSTAVCIYRNWFQYIYTQKKLYLQRSSGEVEAHVMNAMMPASATAISTLTSSGALNVL